MPDSFSSCLVAVKACAPLSDGKVVRFGVPAVDRWLKGGLRRDGMHEFYAASEGERGAAAALALILAARACTGSQRLLWLRIAGGKPGWQSYAPGLVELGLAPGTVMLIEPPDFEGLLVAAVDSVRHGGGGAVMLETQGRAAGLDLTASRRLALAAERSGAMVLMIRNGAKPVASAAHSRWEVASAPSIPLAGNAPGHPVFDLRLLRQRGGRDGLHVKLEWNREQAAFRAPLSGRLSALPARGTVDRRRHRAA